MKLIFIMLVSFISIGCSSGQVHMYGRYLSETEIKTISENIEKLGFDVVTNTSPFPDTVTQSTLIYSPFLTDDNGVDDLLNSLSQIGWPIENTEFLVNGNHWFKKNSVGLYLLPEGMKQNDKIPVQDLINEYESRDCDTSVKIQLNRDQTYQFVFQSKSSERNDHLKGIWKLRSYPYIELTSFNQRWWFYFEIEKKIETDNVSSIEIIELKPLDSYKFFPNCSFAYGQRI
ncbi:hypothetical protein [Thalassotalea sp. ND16A]|uniref:hypothetical protein n=1 Tax=Thalassotalea sp. ND16A TaxID=1535422 RepID=UPI000519EF63|nr:hypothetical protein [Thalassotalea sp. ND16A]KGJ89447.1 hypothetical protein ND16A_2340 [Thalassotalea sp. ND16A]